jgi:hypothetical protein
MEFTGELVLGFKLDSVNGATQVYLVWKLFGWDMRRNKTKTSFAWRSKNNGSFAPVSV